MDGFFRYTIKEIAFSVFSSNIDIIKGEWLRRIQDEAIVEHETELPVLSAGFEKLLDDFVRYLTVEDLESYYKSNEEIACSLAAHDISFEKFISIFHLFEDSYLPLLEDLPSTEFRRYITCLDRLHHKTIAIISKKYFDIKDNMILALTKLIELRDSETAEHLERTREYSVMLARELGAGNSFIDCLYKASTLHDIGKIAISDNILLKQGKLTDEEFEEIKKHSVIGGETIESITSNHGVRYGYLTMARDIALYHHERYDGSGYPSGLKAWEIPLPARIMALADAYDTIVSKRAYKAAHSHEEAVARIRADSGSHFDPAIVEAFLNIHEEFRSLC